jgi:hypothetical protein
MQLTKEENQKKNSVGTIKKTEFLKTIITGKFTTLHYKEYSKIYFSFLHAYYQL